MDQRPLRTGSPTFFPSVGAPATVAAPGSMSLPERVMGLTSLGFLAAVGGVAYGAHGLNDASVGRNHGLLWLIAEIALLLTTLALAEVRVVGFLAFVGFTFVTGITLAPLIHQMSLNGQGAIVAEAFFGTAAITLGLTLYARTTTRDFSGIGGYLVAAVLGLLAMSILEIFFRSPALNFLIGVAGVVTFSMFLVYDIQRTTRTVNSRGNAIRLALSIYLDILNLFVSLLRVLDSR